MKADKQTLSALRTLATLNNIINGTFKAAADGPRANKMIMGRRNFEHFVARIPEWNLKKSNDDQNLIVTDQKGLQAIFSNTMKIRVDGFSNPDFKNMTQEIHNQLLVEWYQ